MKTPRQGERESRWCDIGRTDHRDRTPLKNSSIVTGGWDSKSGSEAERGGLTAAAPCRAGLLLFVHSPFDPHKAIPADGKQVPARSVPKWYASGDTFEGGILCLFKFARHTYRHRLKGWF
jgi:hypothetical protein